jgi:TldD protein
MSQFAHPMRRRDVLRAGALATAAFAVPVSVRGLSFGGPYGGVPRVPRIMAYDHGLMDDQPIRALLMRAIDAAKSAGATYADARITRSVEQTYLGAGLFSDDEQLGIGVRVLVKGAWGFAASPYLRPDEPAILARSAVEQATVNAAAGVRPAKVGTYPVATGSWATPIRIDPFTTPIEEKIDFVRSFEDATATLNRHDRRVGAAMSKMGFSRLERAVASTDGAYFTQTTYSSSGDFSLQVENTDWRLPASASRVGGAAGEGIASCGAGWELLLDAKLYDQLPHLVELAEASMGLTHKPVEVGRYDVVFSASAMGQLVGATFGSATQLDRALGYEANAGGTSYLGPDPMTYLGKATLGTPLLTVTGDRSMAGGLATVKWDDEGVEPDTFPIVEHGVLVDYQTTREQALWLAPWYASRNRPVRSHGCSHAASALYIPIQATPNLTLAPGVNDVGVDELIADVKRGLFFDGNISTDFQSRAGLGVMGFREITNGKLGAVIDGAGLAFDSSQIWKGLRALGGPSSRVRIPSGGGKGQPFQGYPYSIAAVPGVIGNIAVIDLRRGQ